MSAATIRPDESFSKFEATCLFTFTSLSFLFAEILPDLLYDIGPAAWISQIISIVGGIVLLLLCNALFRRYDELDLLQILDQVLGRTVSKVLQCVLLVHLFVYAGATLDQCVDILQVFAYSDMSALLIKLVIMCAVLIFALYSVKGLAKVISIFLPIIAIITVIILILSRRQYDINLLNPILGRGPSAVLTNGLMLSTKYSFVLYLAIFGRSFGSRKAYVSTATRGILYSSLLFLLATICYCMAVPYASASDYTVGILGLAQGNQNGRYLQRLETFYVAINAMAALLFIGLVFLALKKVYCNLFQIRKQYSRAVIVPLALLVLCFARHLHNDKGFQDILRTLLRKYGILVALGLLLLGLLMRLLRGNGRKRAVRTASLLLVPMLIAGLFSGCSVANYMEPDFEIFPLIIGYDAGEKEKYRITMVFMTEAVSPKGQDAPQDTESDDKVPKDIIVFESPSFSEGVQMINAVMPRHISLLHLKMLVISEELASAGVSTIVEPLMAYNEVKPTLAMAVSKCSAYDLIAACKPTLTAPIQSDLEMALEAGRHTTVYLNNTLAFFHTNYSGSYGDGMAIYANLNQSDYVGNAKEGEQNPVNALGHTPSTFQEGYLAGGLPVTGNKQMELAGMAVFRDDKMVGTLDTSETQTLAFLMDTVSQTHVAFRDPQNPEEYYITLDVRRVQPVHMKSRIDEKGRAHIKIQVDMNALVGVAQNPKANYAKDVAQREMLQRYVSEQMTQRAQLLLRKLQQENKADVLQLGRRAARNFLTIDQWEAYDWAARFPEAVIDVSFQIHL